MISTYTPRSVARTANAVSRLRKLMEAIEATAQAIAANDAEGADLLRLQALEAITDVAIARAHEIQRAQCG